LTNLRHEKPEAEHGADMELAKGNA
jgi:hypothetical protein